MGSKVFDKSIDIQRDKNSRVQTAIDLNELKDLSGIFAIRVYVKELDYEFDDDDKKYDFFKYKAKISKNLIFSNIALALKR